MDPKVVLAFTWILAGLVVAAYIWFVLWRLRVDRRKQETQGVADEAMSDAIARTARRLSSVTPEMPPTAPPADAPSAPASPSDPSTMSSSGVPTSGPSLLGRRSEATVADLVSGIALPSDLVPLTTIAPRAAVGDRGAFWTDRAPAEVVGPAFAAELERLGFT